MKRAAALCVVVSGISLLLPSEPSYDPWSWIVWGREVLLLDLDTTGGPSWKPLPVVFTAAFAPAYLVDPGLPAALWLVVARAGALLSVVLAFRVARRLAGRGEAGLIAGAVAALLLAFAPQWLRYAAHGNEVPMAVALLLWAIECHLDRRSGAALVAVFLACLLRPEAFPFLAVYGIRAWRAEPALRGLIAGLAAALPMLWLVPDWLGSGDPLGAGRKASSEPHWSLSLQEQPWRAALERAHRIAGLPLEIGSLAAAAFAVVRRDRTVLTLFGVAVGWIVLVTAMTEAGFSGNTRYFVPAVVIASILTGVAAAWTIEAATRLPGLLLAEPGTLLRRPAARAAAGVAAASALLLAGSPWIEARLDRLERQSRQSTELASLHGELREALAGAGGAERVVAIGPPSVNRAFQTHLAWDTRLPLVDVETAAGGRGLIFSVPPTPLRGRLAPAADFDPHRQPVARAGRWRVSRPLEASRGFDFAIAAQGQPDRGP